MDRERRQKKKTVRPRRKSRLTRQQKLLIAVAAVLAIALAVVLVYKSLFVRPDLSNKPGKSESGTEEAYVDYGDGVRPKADGERKSEDFYTVLILGRDTGGGGNTDTMLLASYDVTNQKATVMSIPRDTMVNVGWDVKKINSVYNWNGGGDKGIAAVYKEVAQLVGFEPDYRVVVEWDAVGKIVDAIGGVYFDVPYNMDYHDPYQELVIEQEKGYRLLDGDDAMQVIRWRKNDPGSPYGYTKGIGDSGRMEVQQNFLKAVIEQMMKPSNVKNVGKIAKVFQECVETDLSFQEILWFGKAAVSGGLSIGNVEFLTMPYKGAYAWSRSYNQNLDYVVPVASQLLDIVNNKLSPFIETFTISDLDIMSVNSDGSLSSTTGYVEDAHAARPPVKPETEKAPPTYTFDEYGNVVDPETGAIVYYVDGEGNLIDANTGEVMGNVNGAPGTQEQPETGDQPEAGGDTGPETGEVLPPEQAVDPEAGEIVPPEQQKPETQEPSGNQEVDPVTGEPLSLVGPASAQAAEPSAPEEPVEPEATPAE